MILTHFLALLKSGTGTEYQPGVSVVVRPFSGFMLIQDDAVVVLGEQVLGTGKSSLSVQASNTVLPVYGR